MRRHGISSAAADDSARPRSFVAGGASAPRVPGRDAKLDCTRSNRNTATANAAAAESTHSNRAAGTMCPKNLAKNPDSAGPRARHSPLPASPGRRPGRCGVAAVVPGSVGSAAAAAVALAPWRGSVGPHASTASHGQLPGTTCCNIVAGDETVESIARTPSGGNDATTCLGDVAEDGHRADTEVDPRELLLPEVKPRGGASLSAPGRFFLVLGVPQLTRDPQRVQDRRGQGATGRDCRIASDGGEHLRREPLAAIQVCRPGTPGAAKMVPFLAAANTLAEASMGPRSGNRGYGNYRLPACAPRSCFNGSTVW
jgi:hypothetical protein